MAPMNATVERVFDRLSMMRDGKFDLGWMHANPAGWGTRARPSIDALTVSEGEGQLDVDRFYRYNETLQEFFDEAAAVETQFVANGG